MSTPPPPRYTAAQVDAAIARIRARHRDADYHLDDGDGPEGVLAYLRKCGTGGLRAGPNGTHDITDAALLTVALWWKQQDHERWVIRSSERLGLNRRRTGAIYGITVGQALVDRLRRLTGRLDRQTAAAPEPVPAAAAGEQPDSLRELAEMLVRRADAWYDDEADLMIDPELLADQVARDLPLRPMLATLVRELDDADPGWAERIGDATLAKHLANFRSCG